MASSIVADILSAQQPELGTRPLSGFIAFVVVAKLDVGVDAAEHERR